MPSKADTELLLEDKERLEKAISFHKAKIAKPLEGFRAYFRGVQWAIQGRYRYTDEIVDNIVYGIVSSFVASTYLGNPKVSVTPKTSTVAINGKAQDASLGAVRHQVLADFLYDELDVNATMELVMVDAYLGHRGVVFTGFEAKTEAIEADAKEEESTTTLTEIIESESLFVDRISPKDFLLDVDVHDPNLKDSKRIYIRWVKTPKEVKDDTGKDIKPNGTIEHKEHEHIFNNFKRDDAKVPERDVWGRVEGYDIWDREKREVRTVVLGEDEYLEKKDWPIDYKGGFPVDVLWFNYMPDSATPMADTELYKGQQDYINIIHSKIVDHIRRIADRKNAYNQSKVKKHDYEEWSKGPSGSGLPGKGDPNTFIAPVNDGGVSQDLYIGINNAKRAVTGMMGVSQFETGGPQDFGSASEAQQETQGVLPKRAFRSSKYKKFLTKVIVKLANVASQVLPTTEIPLNDNAFEDLLKNKPELLNGRRAGRQNEEGEELIEVFPFTSVDKELLAGEFTFNVNIIDIGPESEVRKRQDATVLLQMAGTNPIINKVEATKVFFEAFGFNHLKDRLLRNPEDVAKEQAAAQKAQIDASIEVDRPKRETDLRKTEMKTMAQLASTGIQADQKENEGKRKFITESKKMRSTENVSSLDRIFELARDNGKGE